MKHSSTKHLFQYWNERRGLRGVPDRADIEPGRLKGTLADTFILSFDRPGGHPFRIAGTRLCALFGRELKNAPFVALWNADLRFVDLLDIVAQESVGLVAGAHAFADGLRVDLELLVLPLSHRARVPGRFIGTLVPLTEPYWLGCRPVGGLHLDMHRYLCAETGRLARTRLWPEQPGRARHGLTVYDGGRP